MKNAAKTKRTELLRAGLEHFVASLTYVEFTTVDTQQYVGVSDSITVEENGPYNLRVKFITLIQVTKTGTGKNKVLIATNEKHSNYEMLFTVASLKPVPSLFNGSTRQVEVIIADLPKERLFFSSDPEDFDRLKKQIPEVNFLGEDHITS